MATRTRSVKRTTNKPKSTGTTKRRRSAVSTRKTPATGSVFNTLVPLVFIIGILFCLGFLAVMGYRTVTASSFFDAKTINVRGNSRVSKDDIEKIVRSKTERNGVWNAELEQIKTDIEKLNYVKTAVVSRILPDGIDVRIAERNPRAVVRLNTGDIWIDDDAVSLGAVGKNDARPPFVLSGWDEARKDNPDRLKLLQKMQNDWENLDIAKRIETVNLSDMQEIQVTVQDSGQSVLILLGKEDFGKRLNKALEVIKDKGNSIESLISHGSNVIAKYRS
jgi:cell division septal protein FtsQ